MSRKRSFVIMESIEELRALEELYRGKPEAKRVRLLLLLREGGTLSDAADASGISVTTMKRWIRIYREAGVVGLVGKSTPRRMVQNRELRALESRLANGEFSDLAQVRAWIESQSSADIPVGEHRVMRGRPKEPEPGSGMDVENIMGFIDALPYNEDMATWVEGVRTGMRSLLPEIDRISISVNRIFSIDNPGLPIHVVVSQSPVDPSALRIDRLSDMSHAERFLNNLRHNDFPIGAYHPPYEMTLSFCGVGYLGVILLWKERHKKPISPETSRTFEQLRPLLQLTWFQHIAMWQLKEPTKYSINYRYIDFTEIVHLSQQEKSVFALLIAGQSYNQMAETLHISINTVRSHVRSIYTKAGVHGQSELVAKYFTPKLDVPSEDRE